MSSKLFDLTGRVPLVSGAAQGLGRAMAVALAEAGADLVLADINTAGAQKTAGKEAWDEAPKTVRVLTVEVGKEGDKRELLVAMVRAVKGGDDWTAGE